MNILNFFRRIESRFSPLMARQCEDLDTRYQVLRIGDSLELLRSDGTISLYIVYRVQHVLGLDENNRPTTQAHMKLRSDTGDVVTINLYSKLK